jgi:hypothetical protein
MGDDGAIRLRDLAFERGADRPAPGQFEGYAELLQTLADQMHDPVGIAGRAGREQQFKQGLDQIPGIDGWQFHPNPSRTAVRGNNRSTKRSAVGCGS